MSNSPNSAAPAKLPEIITHLLQEQGVVAPHIWAVGIHDDALHEDVSIQMFQCTRQWISILSLSDEDTRFARYCMTSATTLKVWVQAFTTLVVPLYLKLLVQQNPQAAATQPVSDANKTAEVLSID